MSVRAETDEWIKRFMVLRASRPPTYYRLLASGCAAYVVEHRDDRRVVRLRVGRHETDWMTVDFLINIAEPIWE